MSHNQSNIRKLDYQQKFIRRLVDYFIRMMLNNSDNILAVSVTSRQQDKLLTTSHRNKTAIVGNSDSNELSQLRTNRQRDLDFLFVGRIEKFEGLENIWNIIKKECPKSKFVMVGRAFRDVRLQNIGIDHKG